jgi:alpha-galactosidase
VTAAVVEWDETARQLHLSNGLLSCVLAVHDNGALGLLHLGAPLATGRDYRHLAGGAFAGFSNRLADPVALVVPTPGSGDYRVPGLVVEGADGSTVLQLGYVEHRIVPGKPPLEGLPSTYVEADEEATTVEIDLRDEPTGLVVTVKLAIFADRPVLSQAIQLRNTGPASLRLRCVMSTVLDLPDPDWELVHLAGAWGRERHVVRRRLAPGRQSIWSSRGTSSHEHNPFVALRRPVTTEEAGEALGIALIYSGNFLAEAEVGEFGTTRIRMGIEPDAFDWELSPGSTFAAPEAVVVHVGDGLGAMSDAFHDLFRARLARGSWRDRPRPILVNSWEGAYFDFDEARLVAMAEVARDLGIELFVLDDGWFGRRDDDTSSLGDWFVDRRKLPNGLDGLARRITDLGLRFGLWIEPEMVSERSELFAAHPDWAIGIPGRPPTEGRHQLVLDLTRGEVVDHLESVLSGLLGSAPISYVKWDMNRWLTEPWSPSLPADRQREFGHRYVLGLYDLYGRLTRRFPEILFESCASGGGRFDGGMLAFAPQAWTSDDTDAVERLAIQWGTSLAYPLSSIGAHVSAVPNHQVARVVPLATRAAVAFFGVFGYELDPTALSAAERAAIRGQVTFYAANRELFQSGRFIRLHGPFDGDGNETAWMVVSADRRRAIVGVYRVLSRPNPVGRAIRLRGIDDALEYRLTEWPPDEQPALVGPELRRGDELRQVGLVVDADRRASATRGDFWARLLVLEAV